MNLLSASQTTKQRASRLIFAWVDFFVVKRRQLRLPENTSSHTLFHPLGDCDR